MYNTNLTLQTNGIAFDAMHYIAIKEQREKEGLPVCDDNAKCDHPLIGKQVRYKDGTVYNIPSCNKQWHLGWFYVLLLERVGTHSHSMMYCECKEKPTCSDLHLKFIKDHKENFEII